jgi:CRISPR/Cas system CMR-associated protein Cmr1 (group 7 of RAMP superfamily)
MKSFVSLFLLLNILLEAKSLPYFILSEKSAKCMSITPTRNTKMSIHYHFPDIVVMAEDMEDPSDAKEVSDEDTHFAADELSKRYHERYKRKMEMVKKLVSGQDPFELSRM